MKGAKTPRPQKQAHIAKCEIWDFPIETTKKNAKI
jgi:hypothetical protein